MTTSRAAHQPAHTTTTTTKSFTPHSSARAHAIAVVVPLHWTNFTLPSVCVASPSTLRRRPNRIPFYSGVLQLVSSFPQPDHQHRHQAANARQRPSRQHCFAKHRRAVPSPTDKIAQLFFPYNDSRPTPARYSPTCKHHYNGYSQFRCRSITPQPASPHCNHRKIFLSTRHGVFSHVHIVLKTSTN